MSRATWKRTEREVAARLNGKRVPITGRQRGDVPDVAHDWLSIEVKHRRIVPAWLSDAMAQADAANKAGDRLPVVVVHEEGKRHDDNLVVMRLGDFVAWFGGESDADTD